MSRKSYEESSINAIGLAIQTLAEDTATYTVSEMANAITTKLQKRGSSAPTLQDKTITTNGTYSADTGYDGLGNVTVNVSGGITPTGTKTITENGTYDVTAYASAEVNVSSGGSTPSWLKYGTFVGNDSETIDIDTGFSSTPSSLEVVQVGTPVSGQRYNYSYSLSMKADKSAPNIAHIAGYNFNNYTVANVNPTISGGIVTLPTRTSGYTWRSDCTYRWSAIE